MRRANVGQQRCVFQRHDGHRYEGGGSAGTTAEPVEHETVVITVDGAPEFVLIPVVDYISMGGKTHGA